MSVSTSKFYQILKNNLIDWGEILYLIHFAWQVSYYSSFIINVTISK